MKSFALLALCAVAMLAGCDSMSSRVQERFSTVPPHTRTFAADRRAVFNAAQLAVKNLELLLGKTSYSNGLVEAYAPIRPGDATRDARQTTMQVNLTDAAAGETEVAILVFENTEGAFPGGVSRQALREHSLYEMYFSALQQALIENGSVKASEKP